MDIIKNCKICNNPFTPTNGKQCYCDSCHYTNCQVCGKQFRRRFGTSPDLTCSRVCGGKLASKGRQRATLRCENCGKKFQSASGHTKARFCSRECKCLASRKNTVDKKRTSAEYRKWSKAVYTRDNYTCQHCGSTENIQAHHVKAWKDHPDLRYDVSNGVTVCTDCHKKIHGKKTGNGARHRVGHCENCNRETKGNSKYCNSCAMKLSPKATAQRSRSTRNANGQFVSVD